MRVAALGDRQRGASATVRGRVLASDSGRARFTLIDASGAAEIRLSAGLEPPLPGTIVSVELQPARPPTARRITVLTPYRRSVPFPSPGADYYRLHAAHRIDNLRLRARLLSELRAFFDAEQFIEVQTPQLVAAPGLEPHLVARKAEGGYLITSPEYQMKRLLAAGLERIYFLGSCWRGDEAGPLHLGEFCMLEWYWAFADTRQLMDQVERLIGQVARSLRGRTEIERDGRSVSLEPPFSRVSVCDAFERFAGIDVHGVTTSDELARRAVAAGRLSPSASSSADGPSTPFDALFNRLFVELVEPELGRFDALLLYDYPAPLAALSRLKPEDPTLADRFELYIAGVELANAFGELTDPAEQRERLLADQRRRQSDGAPVYPIDERFVEALAEGIPPSAGIALGVDRLLMLLAGAETVADTVAFG